MKTIKTLVLLPFLLYSLISYSISYADSSDNTDQQLVVAVLPFSTGEGVIEDFKNEVPILFNAFLSNNPSLVLVERGEVDKALSELELSLSGAIDPNTSNQVGFLTGAQVLVTGRIFPVQNEIVVVAKIIGVETGRVYAATGTMPESGSIVTVVESLASQVSDDIVAKSATLVAHHRTEKDVIAELQPLVADKALPTITVSVNERSLGRIVPDPAVATEISHVLKALGFDVLDIARSKTTPDVEIIGEAFSEMGLRKTNLVSSKGRVEIKAIDTLTGKVIYIDHITSIAVDLSPEIAGKKALQKAASKLAEKLIPAIIK